ncbi:MAG: hypothetical protein JXA92_11240 [candidate division Zixibacteria bacterium]|nr:hypothetical protein [candidate division Zixibacteria bacterium]
MPKIENINWFRDENAEGKNEPGIRHSFTAALATVFNHIDGRLDPVRLMGGTAFAFRIFVNEIMCPSAMSVFDWYRILPEAVEQMGRDCYYISRLWDESDKEVERRRQAQELISTGIDNGYPAVVWDIAEAEWGVITGYDDTAQLYETLTWQGKASSLTYDRLGRNGIDILSVTIPGGTNGRSDEEIIRNALQAAVDHAEQKESIELPKYHEGLPAYDQWATIFENWVKLVKAGKDGNIGVDIYNFAAYYASHYFSARCYARDFLESVKGDNENLDKAFQAYKKVAEFLKPVWEKSPKVSSHGIELLRSHTDNIRSAKKAEEEGINHIKKYLGLSGGSPRASISLD